MTMLIAYLNLTFVVILPTLVAVYALWRVLKWRQRCNWRKGDEIDYYGGDQWPHV